MDKVFEREFRKELKYIIACLKSIRKYIAGNDRKGWNLLLDQIFQNAVNTGHKDIYYDYKPVIDSLYFKKKEEKC